MDRIEEKKMISMQAAEEIFDFLHGWKDKYEDEGLVCDIFYSFFIMDPENEFEVYDASYEYTSAEGAEIAIEEILKSIEEERELPEEPEEPEEA